MFDIKNMQRIMKQMGIKSKDIPATKVIIESKEGTIIIKNPSVVQINYNKLASQTFYISGEVETLQFNDEDIKFVMDNANVNKDTAIKLLTKTNGDVAEAIELAESEKEG